MNFLVPQGIGDSIWALLKVQDIAKKAGDSIINIFIACINSNNTSESRSLEFIRRFSFVNKCEMYEMPMAGDQCGCLLLPGAPADADGFYRYIADGRTSLKDIDFLLIPNATLERGIRIENWLPEYEINWDIMDDFRFEEKEISDAKNLLANGKYAVFFLSSASSNSVSGHNRDHLWRPEQWVDLGRRIQKEFNCQILVVGADYDHSYFIDYIKPVLSSDDDWIDHIGRSGIGETFAIIKNACFIISYQSGLGNVANYMDVPAAMFWRIKGNSISPHSYISFDEKMAKAWVKPGTQYFSIIYGRHDVDDIINEIKSRSWM